MAHRTICGTTEFLHNGDLSGDVSVKLPDGSWIAVPGEDLVAFVAQYVKAERMAALEEASVATVLGVPERGRR
jgi:hypothetical protein